MFPTVQEFAATKQQLKLWRYEVLERNGRLVVIFYRDQSTDKYDDSSTKVQRDNNSRGAITFDSSKELEEWQTLTKWLSKNETR